jgi:copper chaperone
MKYTVSPLTCGRCVAAITGALQALDPASLVHVDLHAGTVDAEGDFDPGKVAATLADIGYTAVPVLVTGRAAEAASAGKCCGTCHA